MSSPHIVYQVIDDESSQPADIQLNEREGEQSWVCDMDNASVSLTRNGSSLVSCHVSICLKITCLSLLVVVAITTLAWYMEHPTIQSLLDITHSRSADDTSLLKPDDAYDRVFNLWRGYCETHNKVLSRNDTIFGRMQSDNGLQRVWSMNNQTINYIDHSRNPSIHACQSPDELLDSVKYGTRVGLQHLSEFIQSSAHQLTTQTMNQHIDQSISEIYKQSNNDMRNQTELHSSVFIPSHCTIEYKDSASTCLVLSKFSHVTIIGDSLSRHLIQSLYVTLTEDLRMGGLPALSPQTELYDSCQCDGMYSENKVCRSFAGKHIYHSDDLRSYGVCYDAIDADHRPTILNYHLNAGPHGHDRVDYHYLCSNDTRPRFISLQGIFHYDDQDPALAISELIDPVMTIIETISKQCHNPFEFQVLYTGGHAQSRWLDTRYPTQSRERMVFNNAVLQDHIENRWGQNTIDFWNLTRDAPSSDGLHHLTEVNILKVQYLLNYMDMIA